ncbi:MAG: alginate lyase family protein [Betaproteobacteria bacterium]|nr:alginate lyase family protein [Betaproteobacteria bacterium]
MPQPLVTRGLSAAVLLLAVGPAGAVEASTLRSPFPQVQPAAPAAAMSFVCLPAPPAVRDITANRYYSDAASSVIDPALERRNKFAVKPLEDYLRSFSRMTDLYTRSGAEAVAACALGWLDAWAQGGAMLGSMSSSQADYHRNWTLAGLALNYLKIRDSTALDAAGKQRVEAWLHKLAHAVRPYFDDPRRTRNNHFYWAGLAVAAAGVAANDRALFDWGVGVYREALTHMTPAGTLPLEMARRTRAVHYHNFALAPLVLIAEIGAANDTPLYAESDRALHRLVARTVSGMMDPSYFERAAQAKQDEPPRGGVLAWAEPYLKRFPDAGLPPEWKEQIVRARPVAYPTLGGNLTALYSAY